VTGTAAARESVKVRVRALVLRSDSVTVVSRIETVIGSASSFKIVTCPTESPSTALTGIRSPSERVSSGSNTDKPQTVIGVVRTVCPGLMVSVRGRNATKSLPAGPQAPPDAVPPGRINKVTEPGGTVLKKKDVLAASDEDALKRARAYAQAGASGVFVPGLVKLELIERFAKASPLPVNVMVAEGTPALASLARAGVARVSHGPGPFVAAMRAFEKLARAALA